MPIVDRNHRGYVKAHPLRHDSFYAITVLHDTWYPIKGPQELTLTFLYVNVMKVGFIDTKYSGCNISGSYLQFHPVHQESAWQCVCFPPETESVDGRLFPRRRVRVSTPFAFCLSAAAILAFHFRNEERGRERAS